MDDRELIARRVARELRDNTLVNLGIGLLTMVARYVPGAVRVHFQSENGIIGFGARPPEGMEDIHLTDAGGAFVSALPGSGIRFGHVVRVDPRWASSHDGARRTAG